jgi:hypothetical protein
MKIENISDKIRFSSAFRQAVYTVKREGLSWKRAYFLIAFYDFTKGTSFRIYQMDMVYPSRQLLRYYVLSFEKNGFLIRNHFTYSFTDKAIKYIAAILEMTENIYCGDYYFYLKKS